MMDMRLISKEDFDPKVMFPKLREKTYLFDYHTEESYTEKIMDGSFIIFETDYVILPCEYIKYDTGLRVLEVNVVKPHGSKGEQGESFLPSKGDMEHVKECLSRIEEYCKGVGINRVVLRGRKGWMRVFPEYDVEQVVLIKEM